ncbi:hypothetical protein [Streptomyces yangpuensis]|uniref:hypothetical protein n=1 Tax=Streptomyces yangpuensis TaxID=1648182 RepID=UPI0035D688B8
MVTADEERVRLRGGRVAHKVIYVAGHADRRTACGKNAEDGDFLDDGTPVTCATCNRTS